MQVKAAVSAEAVNLFKLAPTCSFPCGSVSKLQRSTRKRWAVVPPVFAMIAFLLACTRREGALTRTEASGRKSTLFSLFSRTYNTITRYVSAFSRAEGAVRGFKGSWSKGTLFSCSAGWWLVRFLARARLEGIPSSNGEASQQCTKTFIFAWVPWTMIFILTANCSQSTNAAWADGYGKSGVFFLCVHVVVRDSTLPRRNGYASSRSGCRNFFSPPWRFSLWLLNHSVVLGCPEGRRLSANFSIFDLFRSKLHIWIAHNKGYKDLKEF